MFEIEYGVRAITYQAEVDKHITEIRESIQLEKHDLDSHWGEILCPCVWKPAASLQRALLIGVGVAFFQQATGNEAAVYYTPVVFAQAGLGDAKVFLGLIFVGLTKCGFILVSTFLLDKVGRRPLLLTSAVLMTFALAGLAINYAMGRHPVATILMQCVFCGT